MTQEINKLIDLQMATKGSDMHPQDSTYMKAVMRNPETKKSSIKDPF
jgi:hypothetical protein